MKNFVKLLKVMRSIAAMRGIAIVVLVAAIGFSIIACDSGGGGRRTTTDTTTSGKQTNGWPPTNVRNNYGIGGLNQPPGSNFLWVEGSSSGVYVLEITFTPTNDTLPTLETWFTNNGGWDKMVISGATMWMKGDFSVTYQIQPNSKALISGRRMPNNF